MRPTHFQRYEDYINGAQGKLCLADIFWVDYPTMMGEIVEAVYLADMFLNTKAGVTKLRKTNPLTAEARLMALDRIIITLRDSHGVEREWPRLLLPRTYDNEPTTFTIRRRGFAPFVFPSLYCHLINQWWNSYSCRLISKWRDSDRCLSSKDLNNLIFDLKLIKGGSFWSSLTKIRKDHLSSIFHIEDITPVSVISHIYPHATCVIYHNHNHAWYLFHSDNEHEAVAIQMKTGGRIVDLNRLTIST